ncbi:hypothetical protein HRbin15_00443 [bacterium HR15]|nr:hypothetical protein HRbin15_00443 [bacterium HR15]
MTSVLWIFAVPTGADKVTVYWDLVPGATGYRVRWGTASGVYPNVSSVLPAEARKLSITGLAPEQEYYFVVEAAYNGVWGPPSEEDSAVPHVGAIPHWQTVVPWDITNDGRWVLLGCNKVCPAGAKQSAYREIVLIAVPTGRRYVYIGAQCNAAESRLIPSGKGEDWGGYIVGGSTSRGK